MSQCWWEDRLQARRAIQRAEVVVRVSRGHQGHLDHQEETDDPVLQVAQATLGLRVATVFFCQVLLLNLRARSVLQGRLGLQGLPDPKACQGLKVMRALQAEMEPPDFPARLDPKGLKAHLAFPERKDLQESQARSSMALRLVRPVHQELQDLKAHLVLPAGMVNRVSRACQDRQVTPERRDLTDCQGHQDPLDREDLPDSRAPVIIARRRELGQDIVASVEIDI